MSQSSNKRPSVAAALFLPQFYLCFDGFSTQIIPVFMRTLAFLLVQGQLIPPNHPATMYGVEGVRKYRISELMGEAWFLLRTTNASAYQWGIFLGLVLMGCTTFVAIGLFIMKIFFGLDAAQAQIFNHPDGMVTDMTSVVSYGSPSGTTLFDMRPPGAGSASTDYALMVLDKVLRQSAAQPGGLGGSLQKSLGALMLVYNTGVLLIAGIMLFWIVLSIVVDTAKSGQIGGGRHNMVWAPIRIVFALGIMIPLGTTGFSSGQFMVMKLAEWGSNFGSQGWTAYVKDVAGTQNLIGPYVADSVTSLANGIVKIAVCEVSYNTYVYMATGSYSGSDSEVKPVSSTQFSKGTVTDTYTNNLSPNTCGSIWYSSPDAIGDAAAEATIAAASGMIANGSSGILPLGTAFGKANKGSLSKVINAGGPVWTLAQKFACQYVGSLRTPDTNGNPVNNGGCSGIGAPQAVPDSTGISDMITAISDAMITTEQDAQKDLATYASTKMIQDTEAKGWGAMGMWYQDIATLNGLVVSAEKPQGGFEAGTVWSGEEDSDIGKTVSADLAQYDHWWAQAVTTSQTNKQIAGTAITANPNLKTKQSQQTTIQQGRNRDLQNDAPTKDGTKDLMKSGVNAGSDISSSVISAVFPDSNNFILGMITDNANDPNVYPLAELASIGHRIMATAAAMYIANSLLQLMSDWSFALGLSATFHVGWAGSALSNGINSVATTLMLCGIMLSFYIPVLPLIRVAFAVLTWIISVFEAVVMVPIAALAHLTSVGEGIAGSARSAWILWLNVLLRPILVVIGFVGSMLIYNAFTVYFDMVFMEGTAAVISSQNIIMSFLAQVAYTIIYCSVLYTVANTVFKLLDIIPNALMRWLGGPAPDISMDDGNHTGALLAGAQMAGNFKSTRQGPMVTKKGKDNPDTGVKK